MRDIGKNIKDLRMRAKLTQEELAEKLGVSPQAVSKWENNQTCPDIALLPKLAQLLGVSVDELLTGKTAEPTVRMLPQEQRRDMKDMMLRITVDSVKGDKVRVNLPMALVQAAMDMGLQMPQLAGNEALKNIDLNQIVELVRHGAIGNLVEVESAGGDSVHVFVE